MVTGGFALVALAVIQFNPSRTARFPVLAHVFLIAFLHSLIILSGAARKDGSKANRAQDDLPGPHVGFFYRLYDRRGSNSLFCLLFLSRNYG